jgi:hypothetical protein
MDRLSDAISERRAKAARNGSRRSTRYGYLFEIAESRTENVEAGEARWGTHYVMDLNF